MDSHLSRDLEVHNMKTMVAVSVFVTSFGDTSARLIGRVTYACGSEFSQNWSNVIDTLWQEIFFYRKSTCKLVMFLCGNFVCEVYLFICLFIFIFTLCRYLCFRWELIFSNWQQVENTILKTFDSDTGRFQQQWPQPLAFIGFWLIDNSASCDKFKLLNIFEELSVGQIKILGPRWRSNQ